MSVVARGGTLNLIGSIAGGVLTFAFYVLVARGLGKEEVGAFFVALAAFTIVATSCQLGAHSGFVRFIPRHRVRNRRGDILPTLAIGLVPVLAIGAIGGTAMYLGADWLAPYVSYGGNEALVSRNLRAFAPFVPVMSLFTVVVAATQGCATMRPSVIVDKVGRAAFQVVGGCMALVVGGSLAFVTAWALPYALGLLAASIWLLRLTVDTGPAYLQPRIGRGALAREFWLFSGPRGIASIFQVLVLWLDTVLIAVLSTTDQAGMYAVATRYLLIGTMAIGAVLQVIGPKISELLARGDLATLFSLYQGSVAWLMAMVWPVYVTIVVFSPALLLLFGQWYVSASSALALLAAAMLFACACGPVDIVLLMAGRSWYSVLNWTLALVVNVGIDLWLIPKHGLMGAAIGWAASIVVRNLAPLIEVAVLLRLHPFGPGFRRVVAFSLISYGLVGGLARLALGATLAALFIGIFVGSAVYAALLYWARATLRLDLFFSALAAPWRRGSNPRRRDMIPAEFRRFAGGRAPSSSHASSVSSRAEDELAR
jgi:O-antigen/teichoic acid export membrane protein